MGMSRRSKPDANSESFASRFAIRTRQQHNISLEELGDLETLPERIHTEVRRLNTVVNVIPIVSAWLHRPEN